MKKAILGMRVIFIFGTLSGCPKYKIHPKAKAMQHNCIRHLIANHLELAENAAIVALRYNPKYVEAINCRALVEIRRGHLNKAARMLKEALSYNSNFAQARSNLGHIYYEQKHYKRARNLFRSALDIDPSLLNANYNMARTLIALRDWVGARKQLLQMLQFPKNARFAPGHFLLGYVEFERKQFRRAAANFLNATKINPRYKNAYLNLCKALYQDSQYGPACHYCQHLIKLDPNHIVGKAMLTLIDKKLHEYNKRCSSPF